MTPEHRLKVSVCRREDYEILYEQWRDVTFIHCEVSRWSHRVARQFYADVATLHGLLGRPVFALENPDDPRHPKFLRSAGFVPTGRGRSESGREVAIYVKDLLTHGQPIRRRRDDDHPGGE